VAGDIEQVVRDHYRESGGKIAGLQAS
jgi:hypothetical protein